MISNPPNLDTTIQPVPREVLTNLPLPRFFEQYRKPGHPVVITGLLDTEPTWTLDWLRQALGPLELPIRCYGQERYQQDKRTWTEIGSGVDTQIMTFTDFADRLIRGDARQHDLYLAKCPIEQTQLRGRPVLEHIRKALGLRQPVSAWNLWVGAGGHTTCLHYDPFDGTLVQLHGSKRIVLFPPSQLYNIYPFPISVHWQRGLKLRSTYSQVYPDQPDFEAFPRLRDAFQHRYEVVLNQGDVLFIPASWWHEVTTLGDGMVCSVNRFWSIQPMSRAMRLWSKWRSHLGSVLAIPYILKTLAVALVHPHRETRLKQLLQRL